MLPHDLDDECSDLMIRLRAEGRYQLRQDAVVHLQQGEECLLAPSFAKPLKVITHLEGMIAHNDPRSRLPDLSVLVQSGVPVGLQWETSCTDLAFSDDHDDTALKHLRKSGNDLK